MELFGLIARVPARTPWKRSMVGVLIGFGLLFGLSASAANADSILYTEQATGSGSLGGTSFTDALVTIALQGNTTGVLNQGSGLFLNFGTATVTVAGIGTASFTGVMSANAFSNEPIGAVGITDSSDDVLDTFNPALSTYSLTTSIGPISGASSFVPGHSFATTAGGFILNGAGSSTFTAVLSDPVPEPGALEMNAVGFLALMLMIWRRKRFA